MKKTLSDETLSKAIEAFNRDGFYLCKGFFPKEEAIKAAQWMKSQDQAALAKSWTDQEPGVPLAVYQNVHKGITPVAQLAANTELLEIATKLIGNRVYIWSSKINVKAAWCGTVEYYHQDTIYWKDRGYTQADMLTCMTFLDPHGMRNAGLHVFPGSHHLGYIEHEPFINTNGLSKFMVPPRRLDELYKQCNLVCIEADPGDVLFFHANLVHGSAHNISEQSRMILLSQLNVETNKPKDVDKNAKAFNLRRAQMEMTEAKRRYDFFKNKYEAQLKSDELLFNSPIQDEERY
jgi:ectoine hydroxylase